MKSREELLLGPAWRLIDTPPADGAWNMAVDEALSASVREGGAPVLRFYRWRPACLSLGRNQPARGLYDLEALGNLGISVVRRATGGRAVLHNRELTYSVTVADGVLGSQREAYAAINRALVDGLRRLGVPAELHDATGRRAPPPSAAPCFAEPVEGEVVAAGRKLVGSAQRVQEGVLLQHGSLPLEDDQPLLDAVTFRGDDERAGSGEGRGITLGAFFRGAPPKWDALTAALAAGWKDALGVRLRHDGLTAAEEERAAGLREGYAAPAWTWHQ